MRQISQSIAISSIEFQFEERVELAAVLTIGKAQPKPSAKMLETVTVINVYGEKVNTCLGYLGQYNTNKYGSTCVPNLIC